MADEPPAAAASSTIGRYPLRFWLGPYLVLTIPIRVVIEDFQAVPGQTGIPGAPRLDDLPRRARGIYRRSQPYPGSGHVPARRCFRYVISRYDRRLIRFEQSFEDYLGGFSGKTRSTLKRKVRKFAEISGGAIAWRKYSTVADMAEFYDLARELSRHTYQEQRFDAGLPAHPGFRAELQRLAEADQVRAYILFLHGVAISYLYCPVLDGRLCYDRLGFLPEYAEHSPGTVLQFLALEALFSEQKFALFDFGEGGAGQHKRLFATDTVPCANVLYLKRTPANAAMLGGYIAWSWLHATIVASAERVGIRQRIKKWIRGRA